VFGAARDARKGAAARAAPADLGAALAAAIAAPPASARPRSARRLLDVLDPVQRVLVSGLPARSARACGSARSTAQRRRRQWRSRGRAVPLGRRSDMSIRLALTALIIARSAAVLPPMLSEQPRAHRRRCSPNRSAVLRRARRIVTLGAERKFVRRKDSSRARWR
jgi:hypothetical protein